MIYKMDLVFQNNVINTSYVGFDDSVDMFEFELIDMKCFILSNLEFDWLNDNTVYISGNNSSFSLLSLSDVDNVVNITLI